MQLHKAVATNLHGLQADPMMSCNSTDSTQVTLAAICGQDFPPAAVQVPAGQRISHGCLPLRPPGRSPVHAAL